jgi:hypothetical protein
VEIAYLTHSWQRSAIWIATAGEPLCTSGQSTVIDDDGNVHTALTKIYRVLIFINLAHYNFFYNQVLAICVKGCYLQE